LQGAEYIGAMRVHVKREQASSKRTRVAPPLLRFSTDWKLVRRNTTEIASKRVWRCCRFRTVGGLSALIISDGMAYTDKMMQLVRVFGVTHHPS